MLRAAPFNGQIAAPRLMDGTPKKLRDWRGFHACLFRADSRPGLPLRSHCEERSDAAIWPLKGAARSIAQNPPASRDRNDSAADRLRPRHSDHSSLPVDARRTGW